MATKKVTTRKITKGSQVELASYSTSLGDGRYLDKNYTTVRAIKGDKASIAVQKYSYVAGATQTVVIRVPLSKLKLTKDAYVELNSSYAARITPSGTVLVGCQRISAKRVLEVAAEIRKQQRRAAK